MKRLPIALALLALVLAGCRAEVRLRLDVAESGAGSVAAEVGINDQLQAVITQLFGSDTHIALITLEGSNDTATFIDYLGNWITFCNL